MDAAAGTLVTHERKALIDLLKRLGLGAVAKLAKQPPDRGD